MSLLKLIIRISVRFCGFCTPLKLTPSPPPSTSLSTYNLSCARFTLDEVKIRKPTENTKSESASNRILIVMNKKLARLSSIGRTYSISFNSSNVSIFFLEVNEFLNTVSKFTSSKKRVINKALSRRSRATTAKKCTEKRDGRVKLLYC